MSQSLLSDRMSLADVLPLPHSPPPPLFTHYFAFVMSEGATNCGMKLVNQEMMQTWLDLISNEDGSRSARAAAVGPIKK
ncbi:unnamed protein product [Thelazia callipaeda]|uniref:PH domain-containing protein n=1 Tax=Thelazia callipaeda TaxID=103827 RepID=A0A0N5CWC9_THECL|nr:unnamed protein product [Thelazia callipaeda]